MKAQFAVGDLVTNHGEVWEGGFGPKIPRGTTGIVEKVDRLGYPDVLFELGGSQLSRPICCHPIELKKLN